VSIDMSVHAEEAVISILLVIGFSSGA